MQYVLCLGYPVKSEGQRVGLEGERGEGVEAEGRAWGIVFILDLRHARDSRAPRVWERTTRI